MILIGLYLIFGICMCGCAGQLHTYLGRRLGIENTVNYLIEEGIELDEEVQLNPL